MIIGVPKEVKNNEYRVGMTPESTLALAKRASGINSIRCWQLNWL